MANALSNLVKAAIPKKTEFELAHEVAQRNAALPIEKGGLGLPANNTAMDRAKALGYNAPAYHGGASDISEILPEKFGSTTGAQSAKQAFWAAENPETARGYAEYAAKDAPVKELLNKADVYERLAQKGKDKYWDLYDEALAKAETLESEITNDPLRGQNILPLLIRTNNPTTMNAKGAEFVDLEGGVNKLLNKAKNAGSDVAVIKNLADDVGFNARPTTHYGVIEPTAIRSRFAAFDPMQRNSANILAGGALGAIGLGAMMPEEAQASEMPAQGNALSAAANRPVSHPVVRAPLTREERLNAEYGHTPMQPAYKPRNIFEKVMMDAERKRQLQEDWKVAQGKLPADIAYGEEGLQAPSVAGGMVSLDPTDYLGPGALKAAGVGLKSLPVLVGGASIHGMPKGRSMERLIREAQAQIDAENAARNALKYKIQDNRVRNALVGIGAGGAGVAGGYYGADYLSK